MSPEAPSNPRVSCALVPWISDTSGPGGTSRGGEAPVLGLSGCRCPDRWVQGLRKPPADPGFVHVGNCSQQGVQSSWAQSADLEQDQCPPAPTPARA